MGYLPLALELIEQKSNERVAGDVSSLMVLPRPVHVHPAFAALTMIDQKTPLMRGVYRTAADSPASGLTTEYVASQMNVSARTLQRNVRQDTGQPLGRFLRKVKLSQVAHSTTETSASPAQICSDLGFSSESNLRRMFKDETGLTLSEYKHRYGRAN
jgi:transcriptional regulator GlxA family with amidase domain